MCEGNAAFRKGNRYAHLFLIGACPGREEPENGRPFAGASGEALAELVVLLHARDPGHFPSGQCDDYSLLNAHAMPRFNIPGQPRRRTTPLAREVRQRENAARLRACLVTHGCTQVLYLGKEARFADPIVQGLAPGIIRLACGHPSPQAVNRYYPGANRQERLQSLLERTFREL